jgi:thiol-disulfide isomerase/thioredoxin
MTRSKISVLLIILCFIVQGCNTKTNNKAIITIRSKTQLNEDITVSQNNGLEYVTLVESKTDSSGHSSFEVALQKPLFVTIQIGEKYGEVYLVPGYDITVEEVGQNYRIPLKFYGEGAEINNYVSWINSNVDKIKWANGRGVYGLDHNEFLHLFDSLKGAVGQFHRNYTDSVSLTDETISLLEAKNNIKFSAIEQEYRFYKLNNSLNERWEAQRNGQEYLQARLPKEFENLSDEIPFDTSLLPNGYTDYKLLLNFYWHNKINLAVSEEMLVSKAPAQLAPFISKAHIEKAAYPVKLREFLLAFDLEHWLNASGITTETDSLFTSFKNTYEKSAYLPALRKNYNGWLAIAPGKSAPDFEGYTTEGKKVSITDLKGKVVYIDVWATWCGPCIAEIPASKKLQQEFSSEDNLQFLNVSVDGNKSDWKKFLMDNTSWKGLHIIIEPEKVKSLYSTYKLFGVPDYILIDRSGNIVDTKAPRPSAEKTKTVIRDLLAKSL